MAWKDWYAWHRRYADPDSPLSQRLHLVQRHITGWLDERTEPSLRVVSVCAGQGHDLLGVLAERPDAGRVRGRLIECDQRNADAARTRIATSGIAGVSVLRADAGDLSSYCGAVPADLVLLAGVLGNISDADAHTTVRALPTLCTTGATVIWTRTRKAPDPTPAIRAWLAEEGFAERAFHAPPGVEFSVGVHQFLGEPRPLDPAATLFHFVR